MLDVNATAQIPLPPPASAGDARWPTLLRELRLAARPDRARVAAYVRFAQGSGGWAAYREFLANHRAWLAGLDRALSEAAAAGLEGVAHGPLPELESDGSRAPALPLDPPHNRAQALGYLYVLEAFRLGAEVLRRSLDSAGAEKRERRSHPWGDLARTLGAVPQDEHPAVVESARSLFLGWERWLASPLAHAAAPGGALAG